MCRGSEYGFQGLRASWGVASYGWGEHCPFLLFLTGSTIEFKASWKHFGHFTTKSMGSLEDAFGFPFKKWQCDQVLSCLKRKKARKVARFAKNLILQHTQFFLGKASYLSSLRNKYSGLVNNQFLNSNNDYPPKEVISVLYMQERIHRIQ